MASRNTETKAPPLSSNTFLSRQFMLRRGSQTGNNDSNSELTSVGTAAVANEEQDKKWLQANWVAVATWGLWMYVVMSTLALLWLYAKGYVDVTGSVRRLMTAIRKGTSLMIRQWRFNRRHRSNAQPYNYRSHNFAPEDPELQQERARLHREALARELRLLGYA
jgi:hypothetical protein